MRRCIFLILLLTIFILDAPITFAGGSVRVKGYVRKDGTYVQPHYRSAPDGNFYNNWSTKGNINPYTGKEGTKVTPPPSYGGATGLNGGGTQLRHQSEATERASYWEKRGYDFDPVSISAYSMDRKVEDIERAKYWKEKGYSFNPNFMTAYSMDRKVEDIKRAAYWKERGYVFNPDYMTAYSMNRKVEDIERAKYWKKHGFKFNPDYMTSYSMDMEARRILGP